MVAQVSNGYYVLDGFEYDLSRKKGCNRVTALSLPPSPRAAPPPWKSCTPPLHELHPITVKDGKAYIKGAWED